MVLAPGEARLREGSKTAPVTIASEICELRRNENQRQVGNDWLG